MTAKENGTIQKVLSEIKEAKGSLVNDMLLHKLNNCHKELSQSIIEVIIQKNINMKTQRKKLYEKIP
jgi:hypothetical protein